MEKILSDHRNVGFIGLGTMGLPMATHLLQAGYTLHIYNRTPEKTAALVKFGAVAHSSPKEVAQHCKIIFTMVAHDNALLDVALGQDGIIHGMSAHATLIDCSTVSQAASQKVAAHIQSLGATMLDAPVSGSEPHAHEGSLVFMVGGPKQVYDNCQDLLLTMGKQAVYMGENGHGVAAKLAVNTILAQNLVALSEGLILAMKSGIDPQPFMEVVRGGGARSGMAEYKAPKMIAHDFSAQFTTALLSKDLQLASLQATALAIPLPGLSLSKDLFQMAVAKGYAHEDMSALIKCYEEWSHLSQSQE